MKRRMLAAWLLAAWLLMLVGVPGCQRDPPKPPPKPDSPAVAESAQPIPAAEPSGEFTVATFNLNWGNRSFAETAELLGRLDADLVCLQETTLPMERHLSTALRRQYPHSEFFGYQGKFAAERFGVLSKNRLSMPQYYPPEAGLFGFVLFTTTLGGGEVQVANVHLEPVRAGKGGLFGALQAFPEAEKVHLLEIDAILARVDVTRPAIIAGDFNSLPGFSVPERLRTEGFIDSFASVTPDAEQYVTWRWPTRLQELRGRIDYIFHTAELETLQSTIAQTSPSDHFMVSSRLRWKFNKPPAGGGQ